MTLKYKLILGAVLVALAFGAFFSAYGAWFVAVAGCVVGSVILVAGNFFIVGRHPYTIWAIWALLGMLWGFTGMGVAAYAEYYLLGMVSGTLGLFSAMGLAQLVSVMVPDYKMFARTIAGQPVNQGVARARLNEVAAYYAKLNRYRAMIGLKAIGIDGASSGSKAEAANYWREQGETGVRGQPGVMPDEKGNRAQRRAAQAKKRGK